MHAPQGTRILIVDNDLEVRQTLREILRRESYRVTTVSSGEEALDLLRREECRLAIVNLNMPNMDGLEFTRRVVSEWPSLPIVILTGYASTDFAMQAMRLGASDFLTSPFDPDELNIRVRRSIELAHLRKEITRRASRVGEIRRAPSLTGDSAEMKKIYHIVERVAETASMVLIEGEPGTGKELIAREIHDRGKALRPREKGKRAIDTPYVAVNCGAFTRTLLESQLFGHKKGSFTGASHDQAGVFIAARHGTLFLDEITELDLDLQVKFLRAIQEREITPIGSTQPEPVWARIITATNRPIRKLVAKGLFRADLYYRINVVHIRVPPLRERREDIPKLVEHFLLVSAERYGVEPRQPTREVLNILLQYDWPGNVRELQNVIERSMVLSRNAKMFAVSDLPAELLVKGGSKNLAWKDIKDMQFLSLDEVMRVHVEQALQISRGVKQHAASLLGMDRNRLTRLMRKLRVEEVAEGAEPEPAQLDPAVVPSPCEVESEAN